MLADLIFWEDETRHDGFTNMAIDEWLLQTSEAPVLRSYFWQPGWGSFGYFIPRSDLPGEPQHWVRRWTGGGIVDHRLDRTYTLFVPRGLPLAEARGAGSYRTIHAALAAVLSEGGGDAFLSGDTDSPPGGECFVRPVEHDVMDGTGRKVAGAGQRRTVRGLLHQGSVLAPVTFDMKELAAALAGRIVPKELQPPADWLGKCVAEKYRNPKWQERR